MFPVNNFTILFLCKNITLIFEFVEILMCPIITVLFVFSECFHQSHRHAPEWTSSSHSQSRQHHPYA